MVESEDELNRAFRNYKSPPGVWGGGGVYVCLCGL